MQSKSSNDIFGIDVSKHQGTTIDWSRVAASGTKYVFVKATEGKTYVDPNLKVNASGAISKGLKLGFYHYGRPENGNSPADEAANFYNTVKGYKYDFPLVLDIEGDAQSLGKVKLTAWCVAFLQELHKLSGRDVMVYTGASFAKSYLDKSLGVYPLWVAHYGAITPMANDTWNKWAMFQYSSSGSIAGISGNIDVNVMDADFYKKYTTTVKEPVKSKEEEYMLKVDDANKIIKFLSASYSATTDVEARKEFNRLANEIRKASGQPVQQ